MRWLKRNWFKIIAALVLFGAMGTHPYAYYQMLRWVVCLASAFVAICFYEDERPFWMWIFIGMTILFNPIAPFFMSRDTWQGYDLVAGIIFVVSIFVPTKKSAVE